MIKTFLIYILLLFGLSVFAQQTKLHVPAHLCRFDEGNFATDVDIIIDEPDADIRQIWNDLLNTIDAKGINATLKKEITHKESFESFIQDGKGYVVYNADMLNQFKNDIDFKCMVAFILAHELAHLELIHDYNNGPNEQFEVDADEWACHRLCRMNKNAEQTKKAIIYYTPAGYGTFIGYPSKSTRMENIDTFFFKNDCKEHNTILCPKCLGDKTIQKECTYCAGKGKRDCKQCEGKGYNDDCYICKGSGNCQDCMGTGFCKWCHGSEKLVDVVFEAKEGKQTASKQTVRCQYCGGNKKCQECKGKGHMDCRYCNGKRELDCGVCGGKGEREARCPLCNGNGIIKQ